MTSYTNHSIQSLLGMASYGRSETETVVFLEYLDQKTQLPPSTSFSAV